MPKTIQNPPCQGSRTLSYWLVFLDGGKMLNSNRRKCTIVAFDRITCLLTGCDAFSETLAAQKALGVHTDTVVPSGYDDIWMG